MNTTPDTASAAAPSTIQHTVLAAYHGHQEAERAMASLHETGFPLAQIALVGHDAQMAQAQGGAHEPGQAAVQGLSHEGAFGGAAIGGVSGILLGFFLIPQTGGLALPGILMGIAASSVGGTVLGGVLGSAEGKLCVANRCSEYQHLLIAGDFLVIAHGTPAQIAQAHTHLETTGPHHTRVYPYDWE